MDIAAVVVQLFFFYFLKNQWTTYLKEIKVLNFELLSVSKRFCLTIRHDVCIFLMSGKCFINVYRKRDVYFE